MQNNMAEGYPVKLEINYPESSSRGLAFFGILFFLKMLLIIPHMIVLFFINIAEMFAVWLGYWAVLFTGKYPKGFFSFIVGAMRWQSRIMAWMLGLTDKYPPFKLGQVEGYPVMFDVNYPERSSRGLAFWSLLFLLKIVLLIPYLMIMVCINYAMTLVTFFGFWAVLFTGKYPKSFFNFLVSVVRWSFRINAWIFGLTDKYPPLLG